MTQCTECEGDVPIDQGAMVGEILCCPTCGSELEITGLDPVLVATAPEVQEDWGE